MFDHLVPFNYWKYKRVHSVDRKYDENLNINSTEEQKSFSSLFVLCMGIVTMILAGSVGFLAGRHLPPLFSQDFLMAPGGTVTQVWTYNRTFSNPPSKDTDAAWKSIFPRGRGFFSHPSLHVNISGIAVFHELHCLNGIWNAYYDALNQTHRGNGSQQTSIDDEDAKIDSSNEHNDPHHVRHCFDYLRHALMCAADTNLELIDWQLQGSTGWGFERQCRDYDAVVTWAEKWRYHSQATIT